MSDDDADFDAIYGSLLPGVFMVTCSVGHFRLLQSFCFSLKAAAIRQGTDALYFHWDYSPQGWHSLGEIVPSLFAQTSSKGVRLFLIDGTPESGSHDHRVTALLRSHMTSSTIDKEVGELINREAVAKNMTVLYTTLAEVEARHQMEEYVRRLQESISGRQRTIKTIRDALAEVEEQAQISTEAQLSALPPDIAAQVREGFASIPTHRLRLQILEGEVAQWSQTKKDMQNLLKRQSHKKMLEYLEIGLYQHLWRGIMLKGDVKDVDYTAIVGMGEDVERHYFLSSISECPQRK